MNSSKGLLTLTCAPFHCVAGGQDLFDRPPTLLNLYGDNMWFCSVWEAYQRQHLMSWLQRVLAKNLMKQNILRIHFHGPLTRHTLHYDYVTAICDRTQIFVVHFIHVHLSFDQIYRIELWTSWFKVLYIILSFSFFRNSSLIFSHQNKNSNFDTWRARSAFGGGGRGEWGRGKGKGVGRR